MTGPSAGDLALGAAGAAIVLAALIDLFVTVFNYDGFSFLANRLHGRLWAVMRTLARPLPARARHTALSLGSASMLPATYLLWLGLEICGFALMFAAGLSAHGFTSSAGHGIGTGFYLSAGTITSLTFGDCDCTQCAHARVGRYPDDRRPHHIHARARVRGDHLRRAEDT
jgi:hypothetical protein